MRALVLSGGGAKGAWQVGALRQLLMVERQRYDLLAGVSVGALNAGFLAQWPAGQEREAFAALEALWRSIRTRDVHRRWLFGTLAGLWRPSVRDARPLRGLVRRNLDPARVVSSGRKLRIVAVGLRTGREQVWTEEDAGRIREAILASSSYPIAFQPIALDGELYSDGGLRTVTPLGAAIAAGATEVDVVITMPDGLTQWGPHKPNVLQVGVRGMDLLTDQVQHDDVATCERVNELVRAGCAPGKREVRLRVIRPLKPVTEDPLDFSPEAIDRMIAIGEDDGRRAVR